MFKTKPCLVCVEKDSRIADLKAQIADLKRLVLPPQSAPGTLHVLEMESDAVLSGHDEVIELTEEKMAEFEAINSEANRIFSGNI